MSYADKSAQYRDTELRNRAEMCIREQGLINDDALGRGVTAGNWTDIDAVIAATVSHPGAGDLTDDNALLGAVQAVWPNVLAARYPAA